MYFLLLRDAGAQVPVLYVVEELAQVRVGGLVDGVTRACPLGSAVVDEEHLLANATHRTHVVGVDDGGDAILMGDIANESVDDA